jgi:hypothetical protein
LRAKCVDSCWTVLRSRNAHEAAGMNSFIESLGWVLAMVFGVALLIQNWETIQKWRRKQRAEPERPHVFAQLRIEKNSAGAFTFKALVQNGDLKATNLQYIAWTPDFEKRENKVSMPPTLAPHARLELRLPPPQVYGQLQRVITVRFEFECKELELDTTFVAKHRFNLGTAEDLKEGTIDPDSSQFTTLDESPRDSSHAEQIFAHSEGTLCFVFDEVTPDQKPNFVEGGTGFRRFRFNPVARICTFDTVTANGRRVSLMLRFRPSPRGKHAVALEWTAGGGCLRVDKEQQKDYDPGGDPHGAA